MKKTLAILGIFLATALLMSQAANVEAVTRQFGYKSAVIRLTDDKGGVYKIGTLEGIPWTINNVLQVWWRYKLTIFGTGSVIVTVSYCYGTGWFPKCITQRYSFSAYETQQTKIWTLYLTEEQARTFRGISIGISIAYIPFGLASAGLTW